jgi:hypothetical protein
VALFFFFSFVNIKFGRFLGGFSSFFFQSYICRPRSTTFYWRENKNPASDFDGYLSTPSSHSPSASFRVFPS